MGTTTSTTSRKLSQEQQDIKYLGERMPFGDDELHQIYRCYHVVEALPERISFLVDWGVYSQVLEMEEGESSTKMQREGLLQLVEEKILAKGFGNRLYASAFLNRDETSVYDDDDESPNPKEEQNKGSDDALQRLESFVNGISNCSRRGTRAAVKVLVALCEDDETGWVRVNDMVSTVYRVGLACALLQAARRDEISMADLTNLHQFLPDEKAHHFLQAVATSIVDYAKRKRLRSGLPPPAQENGLVETLDVMEWAEDVAPLFGAALSTLINQIFFPTKKYPPSQAAFDFPRIPNESAFFESPSSPLLFSLACLSPSLKGTFYRLYTSLSDGLSFNRLQNALLGYGGPTLLIVRSAKNQVFGAFTGSSWKETKDFYGTSDCFLFQLWPKIAIYRPTGNGRNFMYCNSFARTRGYDNQAHGIGFGGTTDEPRLFIAEDWDNCVASNRDMTFENGPLLSQAQTTQTQTKHFELESLEVWGVGGDEVVTKGLGSQKEARKVKDAAIAKARKVDKAAFLDDFRNGVIESKAFKHQEQIQGRAECDLEDLRNEQRKRADGF